MGEGKRPPYFERTIDDIGKRYEEISTIVKNAIQQPSLIIKPADLSTILIILDQALISSERFKEIFRSIKSKTKRVIGIYIPEEEDIISRLKELQEDKEHIMKTLREFEVERESKLIQELNRLREEEDVTVDIEVMHSPRLTALTEICDREKPDLIIMSKRYAKETYEDISHVVSELIKKLNCPIFLVDIGEEEK